MSKYDRLRRKLLKLSKKEQKLMRKLYEQDFTKAQIDSFFGFVYGDTDSIKG